MGGAGNHSGVVIAGAGGVAKTWLAREAPRSADGTPVSTPHGMKTARSCCRLGDSEDTYEKTQCAP